MPALDAPLDASDALLLREADSLPSDAGAPPLRIPFDNSYARLPERFYARQRPTPVAAPRLVRVNQELAEVLGIDPDALVGPEGVAVLAGNRIAEGSEPIAQAYAGHQFGGFTPQLGDGRAILLGEVVGRDGQRRDIQLKGSGRTPFSRGGDGRAALGPVLREYLVSEAMTALGIPSTRAVAAVTTGEHVYREAGALPGAVLTRVAASHLRVGTFQYFAARRDTEALRILAEYALARHYPDAAGAERPALALLEGVIARQAALVAAWMGVGFIHGVMNTDNSSISGETIDFGPCAFMDAYDPATVFSSIDHMGRYAYGNQPRIALWNATRLAEALLPLLGDTEDAALAAAQEALGRFAPQFEAAHLRTLRRKVGLLTERDEDVALIQDLLERMAANAVDFTLFFRGLCDAATGPEGDARVRALFADPVAYDAWAASWRTRLVQEPGAPEERRAAMQATNPARIPRNHLVEEALTAAVRHGDYAPWEAMLDALAQPYEDRPGLDRYAEPAPEEHRQGYQTFCGT